ncbi:MAG: serine/threonine protein kinase, partial [Candidatus Riflebacteria bacterium]|nr:serine/threonine protein kinase [Candidatus Riflebacteria bacterium]
MINATGITLPPRCAERFRPIGQLSCGGFGVVYLVEQKALCRQVALKVLQTDLVKNDDQVARFLTEARSTASLSHPHIVTLIDHDVEDGVPWIAYEYLPGRQLRQALGSGPMTCRDSLEVARQIASALEEAHSKEVIHRDIKPENVLEAEPGHWKVTDFGIAKWTRESLAHTRAGCIVGTPLYMAPELMLGAAPTARTDLFALGVILYEMLTGQAPASRARFVKLAGERADEDRSDRRWLPSAPEAIDRVLRMAIATRPDDRFASAREFREALEAALELAPDGPVAELSPVATSESQDPTPIVPGRAARTPPSSGPRKPSAPLRPISAEAAPDSPLQRLSRPIEASLSRITVAQAMAGTVVATLLAVGAVAWLGRSSPGPTPGPTPTPVVIDLDGLPAATRSALPLLPASERAELWGELDRVVENIA